MHHRRPNQRVALQTRKKCSKQPVLVGVTRRFLRRYDKDCLDLSERYPFLLLFKVQFALEAPRVHLSLKKQDESVVNAREQAKTCNRSVGWNPSTLSKWHVETVLVVSNLLTGSRISLTGLFKKKERNISNETFVLGQAYVRKYRRIASAVRE